MFLRLRFARLATSEITALKGDPNSTSPGRGILQVRFPGAFRRHRMPHPRCMLAADGYLPCAVYDDPV